MGGGRTEGVYFWRPQTPTRQRPEYNKHWLRESTEINASVPCVPSAYRVNLLACVLRFPCLLCV